MHSSNTSFLLVLLVIVFVFDFQCIFTNGELIAEKWDLDGDPQQYTEDDMTFYLTYDVHDSITAANIVGEFRELTCAEEGRMLTEVDGIVEWGSDIPTPGKGSLYFRYDVDLFRSNSNIFNEESGFHLCVTYILQTTDGSSRVNEKYLDVILSLDSDAGFSWEMSDPGVDENGDPIILDTHNFSRSWGIEVYLCDAASPSVPLTDMAYYQGSVVSVCITPGVDSLSQGLVMEKVESFVWNRGDVQQSAVEDGLAAANLLTVYDCSPGALYCTISSVLAADFYYSRRNLRSALHPQLRPASIDGTTQINRDLLESVTAVGSGQAKMMYADGSSRHLDTEQGRDLQSASETADLEIPANLLIVDDKFRLFRDKESVSSGASSVRSGRTLIFAGVAAGVLFTSGAILFA